MQFQAWVLLACLLRSVLAPACEPLPSFAEGERVINHHWSRVCAANAASPIFIFFSKALCIDKEWISGIQEGLGIWALFWLWLPDSLVRAPNVTILGDKETKRINSHYIETKRVNSQYIALFWNTVYHYALKFNQAAGLKTSIKTVCSAEGEH